MNSLAVNGFVQSLDPDLETPLPWVLWDHLGPTGTENGCCVGRRGYCRPGQIPAIAALLARHPRPTEAQVEEVPRGVLCRCGTYRRLRPAIRLAGEPGIAAVAPAVANALHAAPGVRARALPWLALR